MTKERARLAGGVGLGGLAIAFALLNTDEVGVNWILGTWETPLIVVIGVSFLLGGIAGGLLSARYRRRRRRKAAG